MVRFILALMLVAVALPAAAADRVFVVTNFDRVRVDGPFDVQLNVGGNSSSSKASGDPDVLANLDIQVQGTTLVVRKGTGGWGERGRADGPAPIIVLTTPNVRGASVIGGGRLTIGGTIRGQKLDFQISGSGVMDARGIDSDELIVMLVGTGNVALAGRSGRARLQNNGSGTIAAASLLVNDLMVVLDGSGETLANARYTADVTSTGLGRVVVTGGAKCMTKAQAGGPILCGSGATP